MSRRSGGVAAAADAASPTSASTRPHPGLAAGRPDRRPRRRRCRGSLDRRLRARAPVAEPSAEAAPAADSQASRRRPSTRTDGPPAPPLRRRLAAQLRAKHLEDRYIDVEVEEPFQPAFEGFAGSGLEEVGYSLSDFFSQMAPPRKRMKRMQVADARTALAEEETDRLIDMDRVYDDAIRDVEEAGIVFMDEVDKICGPAPDHGPGRERRGGPARPPAPSWRARSSTPATGRSAPTTSSSSPPARSTSPGPAT